MLCSVLVRRTPEQLVDAAAQGSRKGRRSPHLPRDWQTMSDRAVLGTAGEGGSVHECDEELGSLAPNSQFSQVGLCETTKFLQGIVLRHGESANVGCQQTQRNLLRIWC